MRRRRNGGQTNDQVAKNCQQYKKMLTDFPGNYSVEYQERNYTVRVSAQIVKIFPEPSKPTVKLKILLKVWKKVRTPVLNQA